MRQSMNLFRGVQPDANRMMSYTLAETKRELRDGIGRIGSIPE